jgi:regulator of sigma E protease
MQILISILAYVATIGVLVTVHEFGHFITARKLGIKVLRFSIGFGKPLYTWRRKGDDTEYVLAAIPLGGYVKMLDEREGTVAEADLPRAFNRKSIPRRFAVVLAGPLFNFALAVVAYWVIFMAGVSGLKAVPAYVTPGSPAAQAGLQAGERIVAVAGEATPTWGDVQLELFRDLLHGGSIGLTVEDPVGHSRDLSLEIADPHALTEPNQLLPGLGLWITPQEPVLSVVAPDGSAAASGLKVGDRVDSMDGKPITGWPEMKNILQVSSGKTLALVIERDGQRRDLSLKVGSRVQNGVTTGYVGVGGPPPPAGFFDSLTVEQRYNPLAALGKGAARTADMSWLTLVAGWNMLIGNVSWHNLSGPIDIAQNAGYAAEDGLTTFLEFLAFVSISLGVLNLLPVPVLDGGHLLYFAAEAVKGSPLSERTEALGQRFGLVLLVTLMVFVIYNDVLRVLS